MSENTAVVQKEDLVIKRIINAPVELVWKAWTDPEYVKRWWGPKDYVSPTCKIDLRAGGKFIFSMRAPAYQGGQDSYTAGVFNEITPLKRLEFTPSLSDKDGNRIDPVSIGMPPDFPKEVRTLIEFRAIGDLTELTITEFAWPVSQMMVYSYAGMHQSLDKMGEALAGG